MHFFNGGLLRAALYKELKKFSIYYIETIRELSSVDEVSYQIYKILKTQNWNNKSKPNYRISLEQFYKLIKNRLKIKKKRKF